MEVDINKAHNSVIVGNWLMDNNYAPYCGRRKGLYRMSQVEPLLWNHRCGAVHDERQCIDPATGVPRAVAERERALCLKAVEDESLEDDTGLDEDLAYDRAVSHCASAIRARGGK